MNPPTGLSPLERHAATGPGSAVQRSAKLLASLTCMGRRLPSLAAWLDQVCATSPISDLLVQDVDNATGIATSWSERLELQFAARGRVLRHRGAQA